MHTVRGGGMGELVRRLLARVRDHDGIEVAERGRVNEITEDGAGTLISFAAGPSVEARDVVVAVGPQESFRLAGFTGPFDRAGRSEEHTSELQSLMRNSYAVFCL